LRVGITALVDPGRSFTQPNIAERFVVANAYETLLRMDCSGRLAPGLAGSWSVDSAAGRVRVVLRHGATFWNGDAVDARDVLDGWRTATGAMVATAIAQASTAIDDTTLSIGLAGFDPGALADRELVIRRVHASERWPEGTGAYRIDDPSMTAATSSRRDLRLTPVRGGARLTLLLAAPAQGRDLVDQGVDLLLTDASDVGAYASKHPDLSSVPLPWTRTWVLLEPFLRRDVMTYWPGEDRSDLARDVVPGAARGAERPPWFSALADCQRVSRIAQPRPARPRRWGVAYRDGDHVGRAIAERFVGLDPRRVTNLMERDDSLAVVPDRVRIDALGAADFEAALSVGAELIYIVELPRLVASPCVSAARLQRAIPWLDATTERRWLFPLIDSRDYVLVRGGRVGLAMDWDGTPVVLPSWGGQSVR
jgi:hypothetical protein